MRRRDVLTLGSTAALVPSLPTMAQSAMPVVGYLSAGSPEMSTLNVAQFREGLREGGYAEGRNVAIAFRWADGRYERLSALAGELVARNVAVIVAMGTPAARAALQATREIPVVFQSGADVVQRGLVASLNRPGGNATGITLNLLDLAPKRLELLRDLVPRARSVAYLRNPDVPSPDPQLRDVQAAARTMGLALLVVEARNAGDIEAAFARLARPRPDGLIVASDWLFLVQSEQIAGLATRLAIPAVSDFGAFVTAGGLASYGPDTDALMRTLGVYTAKVLSGARPADLPVQQPTKFELALNLKTAKALGLTIPPAILARADEVVD